MSGSKAALAGKFEIVEMEVWSKEDLDLVGAAYIRLRPDHTGDFSFIAVQASLDWRGTTRDGKPAAEFSFEGFDEDDEVSGRGWAVLEAQDTLEGMVFFHMGDESSFAAKRMP